MVRGWLGAMMIAGRCSRVSRNAHGGVAEVPGIVRRCARLMTVSSHPPTARCHAPRGATTPSPCPRGPSPSARLAVDSRADRLAGLPRIGAGPSSRRRFEFCVILVSTQ
jgi:hypothetical protein